MHLPIQIQMGTFFFGQAVYISHEVENMTLQSQLTKQLGFVWQTTEHFWVIILILGIGKQRKHILKVNR